MSQSRTSNTAPSASELTAELEDTSFTPPLDEMSTSAESLSSSAPTLEQLLAELDLTTEETKLPASPKPASPKKEIAKTPGLFPTTSLAKEERKQLPPKNFYATLISVIHREALHLTRHHPARGADLLKFCANHQSPALLSTIEDIKSCENLFKELTNPESDLYHILNKDPTGLRKVAYDFQKDFKKIFGLTTATTPLSDTHQTEGYKRFLKTFSVIYFKLLNKTPIEPTHALRP